MNKFFAAGVVASLAANGVAAKPDSAAENPPVSPPPFAGATAPFPTDLTCEAKPHYRHRKDGKPGREIAVKFSGGKLYGEAEATIAVEGGPSETVKIPATRDGATEVALLLPEGVAVDKAAKVNFTL